MRDENYLNEERIFLSSTYVRCDRGAPYCNFKLNNMTSTKCVDECLTLKYRFAGTKDE